MRKTVTVLLWILFIFFFLFFLFYLYKPLGKGGSDISLASFIAGFLVGITLLPRFVFCHHYNPRRAMRGAIIAGAVAMLCYCLVLSVQYYIQSRDWNDDLPAIWTHKDIFINYFMRQLRWYFLSPVNLFIMPLWGFMGWHAHGWFHKRDHHFWPVDLTVFE